jgi:hypothetical protein
MAGPTPLPAASIWPDDLMLGTDRSRDAREFAVDRVQIGAADTAQASIRIQISSGHGSGLGRSLIAGVTAELPQEAGDAILSTGHREIILRVQRRLACPAML